MDNKQLIEQALPYAINYVKENFREYDITDLCSIAVIGLLQASYKYDKTKEEKDFNAFSEDYINKAINDYIGS